MLFTYPDLVFTQLALLIVSGIWLLRRNDEIPMLISCFLFYVASYRYWAVTSGIGEWVNVTNFGLPAVTDNSALIALSYIIFGQLCLLLTYMLRQRQVLPMVIPAIGDCLFFQWLRPKVIPFSLFCLPLVVLARSSIAAQVDAGKSLAFQVSNYLFLFPLALVGIATLILCIWKFNGLPSTSTKIAAVFILIGVSYLTFGSYVRFQFLGWLLAGGVILSCSYQPKTRLIGLAGFLFLSVGIFSLMGAMRSPEIADGVLDQAAWKRTFSAEDGNMLDGFVLLRHVYPQRLNFAWGMEHLEILMRPIPRAWWPEKPVGGYMNKLNLIAPDAGGTLGISPTLFGSFYAEGGIIGIFFFCLLYGVTLAAIVDYSTRIKPFASVLVRAIICASLIPLLRGGDLPGIYAWIGMSFWPCFLLLWIKRVAFRLESSSSTHLHRYPKMPPVKHPDQ